MFSPRRPPARMAALAGSRLDSIDVVRGAVMVLMALDHVRDFVTDQRIRPEDLERTTAALFATRWVTHFCAPAFSLLAGVGVGLMLRRGRSEAQASRFLVTRGLWLVVLDVTASAIGFQLGFRLLPVFALVLWALGWSMVAMAALVHLPRAALAVAALLVVALHDLADGLAPSAFGALAPLWHFLHVAGFAVPGVLFIGYPLVPWVAVMALGYLLADVYTWDAHRRREFLVRLGAAATLAFVLLRAFDRYGDPVAWSRQRTAALTAASFLNVQKYPPSVDFLLMTLGPVLLALALAERWHGRPGSFLAVYGRVPLFYYLAHIYVAHVLAVGLARWQLGEWRRLPILADSLPPSYGVPLPGVFVFWAGTVLLLYVPCRWFAGVKARRADWWLRYL
jgi:uncharacterized membrane protein